MFLNFNLTVNSHKLNILPPFVGFLPLLRGMRAMEGEHGKFRHPQPFAIGMVGCMAIVLPTLLACFRPGFSNGSLWELPVSVGLPQPLSFVLR